MTKMTGRVAEILDINTVIINKGTADGLKKGQRVLIYRIGQEIIDPETKENLGRLEIVCGEGIVSHVQNKISTVKSDKIHIRTSKRIIRANGLTAMFGTKEEEEINPEKVIEPFENVDKTCIFKIID